MTAPHSDALVFFGATGDLAYKQIFPALQAMIRHGHLDMPVIGVAKAGWNLDQWKARARDSVEKHGGMDTDAFPKLAARLQYIDGDYRDTSTYERYVRFRLSPDVFISVGARVKAPGEEMAGEDIDLIAHHHAAGEMMPYERLLGDAIGGDASLFVREDGVEAAWRIIDPILGNATPVVEYEPNTWGPPEADRLIASDAAGTSLLRIYPHDNSR